MKPLAPTPDKWQPLLRLGTLCALACGLGLLATPALAQNADALLLKRDTPLRAKPDNADKGIAPLVANSAVQRTGQRQGAWVQVRTAANQTGWVHMFDLTSATRPASGGADGLRTLGGLVNRPQTNTVATTTAGIRGLDANDIAKAQPNPAAVTRAEGLRVSAADAQQFATRAALKPENIADLPVPAKP